MKQRFCIWIGLYSLVVGVQNGNVVFSGRFLEKLHGNPVQTFAYGLINYRDAQNEQECNHSAEFKDKQMYLRLKAAHDLSGDQVRETIRQLDEAEHPVIRLRDKIITKEYDRIALFTPNDDYSYTMNSIRYFRTDYFQIRDAGSKIEGVTVSENDYPLTIRNFRQGDRIAMRFGTKAVNRFFIDRKIPLKERLCYPIVTNRLGEVIFVPGLGCDVHHFSESPTFFVIKL